LYDHAVSGIVTKIWLSLFFSGLMWSGINPKDYLTWLLEVAPALIGFVALAITYKRFPLTPLVYQLILIHSLILMVGGHYTYAEEPLFNWLKEVMAWERNNYDKLGHFAQGFVPALITREVIIRHQVVTSRRWLNFFVVCICMAISSVYELIEWGAALVSEQATEAFLGTQGYVWDTQSDMAFALLGAIFGLITLSHLHDKQLDRLPKLT
jgi:putative membrane protein